MTRRASTAERTQQQRTEATTAALVAAAKRLFAKHGYATTSLDDVANTAGVSKGALYHHFAGKRELFQAVFEDEQRRMNDIIKGAYKRERDAWKGLYAGCKAFLEGSLASGFQRICILDGPAVLGWEFIREFERDHAIGQLSYGLRAAGLPSKRAETVAHLVFGSVCEGAMLAARSGDPRAATRQVLGELHTVLEAVRR